jgi:hypothetical protein
VFRTRPTRLAFYVRLVSILCVLALVEFVPGLCQLHVASVCPGLFSRAWRKPKHGAVIILLLEVLRSHLHVLYEFSTFLLTFLSSRRREEMTNGCVPRHQRLEAAHDRECALQRSEIRLADPESLRDRVWVNQKTMAWMVTRERAQLRRTSRARWREIGRLQRRLVLSVRRCRGKMRYARTGLRLSVPRPYHVT